MLKRILRFERTAFDQHHTKKKNSSDQTAIHNDFRSGIRIGDELDAYCHQGKYKSGTSIQRDCMKKAEKNEKQKGLKQ